MKDMKKVFGAILMMSATSVACQGATNPNELPASGPAVAGQAQHDFLDQIKGLFFAQPLLTLRDAILNMGLPACSSIKLVKDADIPVIRYERISYKQGTIFFGEKAVGTLYFDSIIKDICNGYSELISRKNIAIPGIGSLTGGEALVLASLLYWQKNSPSVTEDEAFFVGKLQKDLLQHLVQQAQTIVKGGYQNGHVKLEGLPRDTKAAELNTILRLGKMDRDLSKEYLMGSIVANDIALDAVHMAAIAKLCKIIQDKPFTADPKLTPDDMPATFFATLAMTLNMEPQVVFERYDSPTKLKLAGYFSAVSEGALAEAIPSDTSFYNLLNNVANVCDNYAKHSLEQLATSTNAAIMARSQEVATSVHEKLLKGLTLRYQEETMQANIRGIEESMAKLMEEKDALTVALKETSDKLDGMYKIRVLERKRQAAANTSPVQPASS